jgi:activating signal cointegrator 1
MKALTLTQPYATLVAIGAKTIETRSWPTAYRGRIAIHAGKGLGPVGGTRGLMDLCRSEPFRSVLIGAGILGTPALPLGAIVATARITTTGRLTRDTRHSYIWNEAIRAWTPVSEQEAAFGDYTEGRWGFVLADVKPLAEPIPAKGALGLWDWTPPEGFAL